jgi:hypothetical protein
VAHQAHWQISIWFAESRSACQCAAGRAGRQYLAAARDIRVIRLCQVPGLSRSSHGTVTYYGAETSQSPGLHEWPPGKRRSTKLRNDRLQVGMPGDTEGTPQPHDLQSAVRLTVISNVRRTGTFLCATHFAQVRRRTVHCAHSMLT